MFADTRKLQTSKEYEEKMNIENVSITDDIKTEQVQQLKDTIALAQGPKGA